MILGWRGDKLRLNHLQVNLIALTNERAADMFNTNMSAREILKGWQQQRRSDLAFAKSQRDQWQAIVEKLERDIAFNEPEIKDQKPEASDPPKGWLGTKTLDGYNG